MLVAMRRGGVIAGCESEMFIHMGAGFVKPAADLPSVRPTRARLGQKESHHE